MRQVKFFIPTEPVPQARPRSRVVWPKASGVGHLGFDEIKKRTWVQVYEPAESRNYKKSVKEYAYHLIRESKYTSVFPLDIPLVVGFTIWISRPESVTRAVPSVKPDLDNYIKAIVDGLSGVIWRDDNVIVGYGETLKLYADGGQAPGVQVIVKPYGLEEFPNSQETMFFQEKE